MTLKPRILLPAATLFLMVLGMFCATWIISSAQQADGLVINLAGRQRLLSQKRAKETLPLATLKTAGKDAEVLSAKVDASMKVFELTLAALTRSGEAPVTLDPAGPTRMVPAAGKETGAHLGKFEALWVECRALLEAWRNGTGTAGQALLQTSEAVNVEMDKAVSLLQRASEDRVGSLLWTQGSLVLWRCFSPSA